LTLIREFIGGSFLVYFIHSDEENYLFPLLQPIPNVGFTLSCSDYFDFIIRLPHRQPTTNLLFTNLLATNLLATNLLITNLLATNLLITNLLITQQAITQLLASL